MATHRDSRLKEQCRELALQVGSSKADNLTVSIDDQRIELTHLNKRLWVIQQPDRSLLVLTKRKLIEYYALAAPIILPHLKDRPLTIKRFPDGITNESFVQRHLDQPPEFLQTVEMYAESAGENTAFILCQNVASLIYLANLNTIELHPWYSRINPEGTQLPTIFINSSGTLELSVANYPDMMIFDLDPSPEPSLAAAAEASPVEPFEQARQAAYLLHQRLTELDLESWVKTSGQSGLHVAVPLERRYTFDTVRAVAHRIGQQVTDQHNDIFTTEWQVTKRQGKVFLDLSQNARAKSLVSPYSLRAHPSATISMPLSWEQLASVQPDDFALSRYVGVELDSSAADELVEVGTTTGGERVTPPAPLRKQDTAITLSQRLVHNAQFRPSALPKDAWRFMLSSAQILPPELMEDR